MDVIAERTKQALHIGSRDFQPLSIERHERMLEEVGLFHKPLRNFERAARIYDDSTKDFLQAASLFLLEAPSPRRYAAVGDVGAVLVEGELASTPEEYRNLMGREFLDDLRHNMHLQVSEKMNTDVLVPLDLWLQTYDTIKQERMPRLQRLKIKADAVRRKLEPKVLRHQEKSEKYAGERMDKAQSHAEKVQEYSEQLDPALTEFDAESSAVEQQLEWMVHQAGRLKILTASTLDWIRQVAQSHSLPPNLLEHFPAHTLESNAPAGSTSPSSRQPALTSSQPLRPASPVLQSNRH